MNINKKTSKLIGLIGRTNNIYNGINAVNLINKTTIKETLSLISKTQIVIAPVGFVTIVGASMNKQVFSKEHPVGEKIKRVYYHPEWIKNKFIDNLNKINL